MFDRMGAVAAAAYSAAATGGRSASDDELLTASQAAAAETIIPPLPDTPTTANVDERILVSLGTVARYTVADGTTLFATETNLVFAVDDGPKTKLVNDGTIWVQRTGAGAVTCAVGGGELGNITNNGLIASVSEESHATAVQSSHFGRLAGEIMNNGQIYAISGAGNAAGIETSSRHAITNNGLIAVKAKTSPLEPHDPWWPRWNGNGYGIRVDYGHLPVTNGPDGRILVEADRAIGIWMRGSDPVIDQPYEISNAGLIKAVSTEPGTTSVGLLLVAFTSSRMRVVNSGTIEADQAILAPSEGWEAELPGISHTREEITNTARGVIRGSIELRNGDDLLVNQGRIIGDVDMGPGDDVVESAGSINGIVYLGLGEDLFRGSSGTDRVSGEREDDALYGNGGQDLLLGGPGDDVLVGGMGNDGLYGEFGSDRIVTSGGDVARGGDGNDRLEAADYKFRLIDGGTGFDTLVLPAGDRIFDLRAAISTLRIANVEEIVLNGTQQIVVRPGDIGELSDGAELRITASATNKVHLLGRWSEGATQTVGDEVYRSFSNGGATVLVREGAAIAVNGAAPAAAVGLDAIASGGVAPAPGEETGLYADSGLTVVFDPILLEGSFRVESYETWQAWEGQAIFGSKNELVFPEIINAGTLLSQGIGRVTPVIGFYDGNVRNSGTIWAVNSGDGLARAILISAEGQVFNEGDILATALNGDAMAVHTFDSDGAFEGRAGVTNDGLIAAASEYGFGLGIVTFNGYSLVKNNGTIEAYGGRGAIAVDMGNAGGRLVNRGEIYASAPATSEFASIGFYVDGYGSLFNSGVVAAEIAVLIQLRQGEAFDMINRGTITGTIYIYRANQDSIFGSVLIDNRQNIFGDIFSDPGMRTRDTIINSGRIEGTIILAGGDDTYNGSVGSQGAVFGEDGNDRLTGGAGADRLFGGNGADTLTGGRGNDVLDGGADIDSLSGGVGNDTYVVGDDGDAVIEAADGGIDTVLSSLDYVLAAELENLTLTGAADVHGTGNAADNIMVGNGGANILGGGGGDDRLDGGAGSDSLQGGSGNDSYQVDDPGDRVVELGGGGDDIVRSSVSHTLGANVERLVLTGRGAIDGYGNSLVNVITGNAAANLLDGAGGADVMVGGRGNDIYVVDSGLDALSEAAGGGIDTVRSSIGFTLGAHLENLVLTGTAASGTGNALANSLTGNAAANTLSGGGGDDVIDGKAGADTMNGGYGNDRYHVDNLGDKVVEGHAAGGLDTVSSLVSFTLEANVENLVLTGSSTINGTGNGIANRLSGNAAANVLNGAGGADTMTGFGGDDTYIVDQGGDKAVEASASGGTDTVRSSVAFALGAHVENLVLTGVDAIGGTGNALANVLTGNGAANLLDGRAGADTMTGGGGNDVYVVDNALDKAVETENAGVDEVRSSVGYRLGVNVEKLTLTGSNAIAGTGNILANTLTGNSAANRLDGGAAADQMSGGGGNDTYVVDNIGDKALEASASGGTDTVESSVSFTLGANVEKLILTGSAASKATGNALANTLTGNSAANILNGGTGADTMTGGGGNDTYVVDNALDKAVEGSASGGTDTVQSAVSFILGANLENLTLTGTAANGTGNALANIIAGNASANVLKGGEGADTLRAGGGDDQLYGGAGADLIFGGDGADRFVFDQPAGAANADRIGDFTRGQDKILLENAVFAGLPAGALAPGALRIGSAAADADDRIIYNPTTGVLSFDRDGTGTAAALQFAVLDNKPATLSASDFTVI
ncbi:MAG: hypothetical protein M3177_02170 [Pseudomonadota bacterium]|nr:hypothetical protein [Pseudomonadota bacterium]